MRKAFLERAAALIKSLPVEQGHEVSHDLFFARSADAEAAAAIARRLDCEARTHEHRGMWCTVVAYRATLGPETIAPIVRILRALAKRYAGEYGGWRSGWLKRNG